MPFWRHLDSVDGIRADTGYLWLVLVFVWALWAFAVKPTLQRQAFRDRFWYVAITALGLFLVFHKSPVTTLLDSQVLPPTYGVVLTGFIVTCFGIAFSIWARLILGGNWSGPVTIKQDHTLVRRGPYRIVRHPIYTGLLIALTGSALQYGHLRSFAGVLITGFGFWLKSLIEEQFMFQRFGNEYLTYRKRVRALVPFIF